MAAPALKTQGVDGRVKHGHDGLGRWVNGHDGRYELVNALPHGREAVQKFFGYFFSKK
jgi:hypothetical protein